MMSWRQEEASTGVWGMIQGDGNPEEDQQPEPH